MYGFRSSHQDGVEDGQSGDADEVAAELAWSNDKLRD